MKKIDVYAKIDNINPNAYMEADRLFCLLTYDKQDNIYCLFSPFRDFFHEVGNSWEAFMKMGINYLYKKIRGINYVFPYSEEKELKKSLEIFEKYDKHYPISGYVGFSDGYYMEFLTDRDNPYHWDKKDVKAEILKKWLEWRSDIVGDPVETEEFKQAKEALERELPDRVNLVKLDTENNL